jgi:hypothetical protein
MNSVLRTETRENGSPGRMYELNNERTRQRSKRTPIAFLGTIESVVATRYMTILDAVGFVRRTVLGKERGGMVISIAGIVSIRLAALDSAMSGIAPCAGVFCVLDRQT